MKRIRCMFLSAVFIISLFTMNVFAGSSPGGVEIKADREEGEVKIEGSIAEGPWKEVTAAVVNPLGGVDYIGQTTSGSEGAYTFNYKLKKEVLEGKYLLLLGGSHTDSPVREYFDFTAPGEVRNLRLSSGDGSARIEWEAPVDEDLEGVNLYINGSFEAFLGKDSGSFQKTGLSNGTTYTFTLKTVDRYGNESAGADINWNWENGGQDPDPSEPDPGPGEEEKCLEKIIEMIERIIKYAPPKYTDLLELLKNYFR